MEYTQEYIRRALRLYAVTDELCLRKKSLESVVRESISGGVSFVQVRNKGKNANSNHTQQIAEKLLPICRSAHVPLVIDDDLEVALHVGADGVHVGQSDVSCEEIRKQVGDTFIVGVSVQNTQQALAAQKAGATYLGVGAVLPTSTKKDAHLVSLDELQSIVQAVDIPVVAIGGLNRNTASYVRGSGVAGIAVVSALFGAEDPAVAARELLSLGIGHQRSLPAVLSIAGSDSSGGAGIQADIKTVQALGLFAETAVTAITAQNTKGVQAVQNIDTKIVEAQIDSVFDDIPPSAVKVGMVSSTEIAEAIARALKRNKACHVVVDPVLVATSGFSLAECKVIDALKKHLFPLATVITPNMQEAEALVGFPIKCAEDAVRAGEHIMNACSGRKPAVLIKGGHGLCAPEREQSKHSGAKNMSFADDVLVQSNVEPLWLCEKRVDNSNTHGTGCTLSSAIASYLALGYSLEDAIRAAKNYLTGALRAKLNLGHASGPLDHFWRQR